jgi:5-formyltetrahydrofolate cyclo-ligase
MIGSSDEVSSEKVALRREAAVRRGAAFAANPLAGLTLAARLPRAGMPEPGTTVSAYWPFRTEIDSRPLMRRLAATGARLALPVAPTKGADDIIRFHLWAPGQALHPSPFGVHEPYPHRDGVEPDLVLVPLLAFDRNGGRLGYGGGHYDRTLKQLRAAKPIRAIGLAFAAQERARVPTDLSDQPLDAILTERGFISIP